MVNNIFRSRNDKDVLSVLDDTGIGNITEWEHSESFATILDTLPQAGFRPKLNVRLVLDVLKFWAIQLNRTG